MATSTTDLEQPQQLQLDALPDSALALVMGMLYEQQGSQWPARSSAPYTIVALQSTCRSLRSAVRRVHTQVRCRMAGDTAQVGRDCAMNLNSHAACSAVHILCPSRPGLPMAAFLCHVDSAPAQRVQQLRIMSEEKQLDAAVVLMAAQKFPQLHTVRILSCVEASRELFPCLAACCPQLQAFEVCVPAFTRHHLGGLSELRGLTSLTLKELHRPRSAYVSLEDAEGRDRPDASNALQQAAALTDLTHLSLTLISIARNDNFNTALQRLAHLPLRHLELFSHADINGQHVRSLAALPCLEHLHLNKLSFEGPGLELMDWCLPRLERLQVDGASGSLDRYLYIPLMDAAALAAACPTLRQFNVGYMVENLLGWLQDPCGPQRWARALSALEARGLRQGGLRLEAQAYEDDEDDALREALQQLQPEQCAVLAEHVTELNASQFDEALACSLLARLPQLRSVKCVCAHLPALAQLRHLERVELAVVRRNPNNPDPVAVCEALLRFAEDRARTQDRGVASQEGGSALPLAVVHMWPEVLPDDMVPGVSERLKAGGVRLVARSWSWG